MRALLMSGERLGFGRDSARHNETATASAANRQIGMSHLLIGISGRTQVLTRTISAVPVRSLSPADRRLTRFVVGSTIVGLVFLGVGVWDLMNPVPELQNAQYAGVWFGALVIGVLAVGSPWVEVVRRLRRGDHEPGSHTSG